MVHSGVDPGGGGGPLNIWRGGMAYVIIPPMLWKVNNVLAYFTNIQSKATYFAHKNNCFFMILAKFYQKFLPKYKLLVSQAQRSVLLLIACYKFLPKSMQQIAWFQLQKFKIFQLLRGHIPLRHPPLYAQARSLHWRATKSYPKCRKRIYAPDGASYSAVPKMNGETSLCPTVLHSIE